MYNKDPEIIMKKPIKDILIISLIKTISGSHDPSTVKTPNNTINITK